MKQVNMGYDVLVTVQTIIQTDIVNKQDAIEFAKELYYQDYGIHLRDNEIELIENITTTKWKEKYMIDYKELSDVLLNNFIDIYGIDDMIVTLIDMGYTVENLIELQFDVETINNAIELHNE